MPREFREETDPSISHQDSSARWIASWVGTSHVFPCESTAENEAQRMDASTEWWVRILWLQIVEAWVVKNDFKV